jgi:hypothetical protein
MFAAAPSQGIVTLCIGGYADVSQLLGNAAQRWSSVLSIWRRFSSSRDRLEGRPAH